MWTVFNINHKKISFLKKDLYEKLGENFIIYSPKLLVQKYKNNKLVFKTTNLLGDYLFCYHSSFKNPANLINLKFIRGLKYILSSYLQSQEDIKNFINNCKKLENDKGYLDINFKKIDNNKNIKFLTGPFAEKIFKIVNLKKNKIKILIGSIKATVSRQNY